MRNKLQRRLLWVTGSLVSLLVILAILIALLPNIAKSYIISWLEEQNVTASIEDIKLRVWDGRVRIEALTIRDSNKTTLHLGELNVQFTPGDLWDNKITLESLQIKDVYLDIVQQEGKPLKIAGLSLPASDKSQSEPTRTDSVWQIQSNTTDISQFKTCLNLKYADGKPKLHDCLSFNNLAIKGKTNYSLDPAKSDTGQLLNAVLSLQLNNLRIQDQLHGNEILSVQSANFKNIQVDGLNKIQADTLKIKNYSALQRDIASKSQKTHVVQANHIDLNKINVLNLNQFAVDEVALEGLHGVLVRNANGELEPVLLLARITGNRKPVSEGEKSSDQSETEPLSFQINRLAITGDSSLVATDAAMKPSYNGKIKEIRLEIDNIDSTQLQRKSPVNLSAVIGEHGKLTLSGEITLFAVRPTANISGKIRVLNVTEFSTYVRQILQYHLKSGYVDADIDLSIEQGKLDSVVNVVLHKFYVEKLDEDESSEYKERIGVPLTTALNLLRESDDSIRIKLPVTGDIENPQFSLKNIIRDVSADAIKTALINYYTPYGLVALTTSTFKFATALRFEPLLFEVNKSDMTELHRKKLNKIAELLTKKSRVKLVVCGQATLKDRFYLYPVSDEVLQGLESDEEDSEQPEPQQVLPALSEQQRSTLESLAKRRGKIVFDYLVNEKKISPEQLLQCNPRYTDDQSKPRVELTI